MNEQELAVGLANRILDRVNADPDDDLAILSRQLLRATERESLTKAALLREAADCMKEALEAADAAKANRGDEWDDVARHLLIRLLHELQAKILAIPTDQLALDRHDAELKAQTAAMLEKAAEISGTHGGIGLDAEGKTFELITTREYILKLIPTDYAAALAEHVRIATFEAENRCKKALLQAIKERGTENAAGHYDEYLAAHRAAAAAGAPQEKK